MLPSIRLLWRCPSRANHTAAASLLSLIQAILRKNCNFSLEKKKKKTKPILRLDCHRQPSNKRLQKPTLGCLFESLMRKRFNFFETVSSSHLNLQFQLRSVREVYKDLNTMSSSLSADQVKYEPELIKGSYEQTRECIW